MTEPSVSYHTNPRFVPDNIAIRFGGSDDAALLYDAAADELTIQTKNLAGTLVDRIRIQANLDAPTIDFVNAGLDDGVVGAPALAFAADSDTGIWRSAADTLNLSAGGVEIAEFDQTSINLTKKLVASAIVDVNDTTDATDASGATGSIQTLGGISVAKKAYFGDSLTVRRNSGLTTLLEAYGGQNTRRLRRAGGTIGSPTVALSGDVLSVLQSQGYHGSGFHDTAQIRFLASANFNNSPNEAGSKIEFFTVDVGDTSVAPDLRLTIDEDGSVIVGSPTGGGKGPGTINAVAVYDDNVLLTDYVFEDEYELLSVEQMRTFFRRHKHLPTIPGREAWEKGSFSVGKIATHLWETVEVQARYIAELHDRVAALEAA